GENVRMVTGRPERVGPRGRTPIPVSTTEHGAALTDLTTHAGPIAAGTHVLTRDGRVLEQKLSAVTENFNENFTKIIEAVTAGGLPDVADILTKIRDGQAATIRITVELVNTQMSAEARSAAEAVLNAKVA